MTRGDSAGLVNWDVPSTDLDALYGDGATRAEKNLARLTGILGVGAMGFYTVVITDLHWTWWQHLVAAVVTFDLVGGVVAMGLNSAKRFHKAPGVPVPRAAASLVRNEILLSALHVHAILLVLLFPGGTIWWGLFWYGLALGGVLSVIKVPLYLARPVALAFVALAPLMADTLQAPAGFAWVPSIMMAKLVLGAAQEEPYRPG